MHAVTGINNKTSVSDKLHDHSDHALIRQKPQQQSIKHVQKNFKDHKEEQENLEKELAPVSSTIKKGNVAIYEEPLSDWNCMPLKSHVMGRCRFFQSTAK